MEKNCCAHHWRHWMEIEHSVSSTWRTHSHSAASTCRSSPISGSKATPILSWTHCRTQICFPAESYMGESVAAIRLIREQLREVVGRGIATAVAETRIQQLLQLYGEEEEGVRCVLHTLLEEVLNEEEQDGFVIFDKEEIASVSTSTNLDFTFLAQYSLLIAEAPLWSSCNADYPYFLTTFRPLSCLTWGWFWKQHCQKRVNKTNWFGFVKCQKMTGGAQVVRSDKRKPVWTLFEQQSASVSINQ